MSERTSIEARLRQLAGEDEAAGSGRVVARAAEGAEAVAQAVLNAIDETVLAADLTFTSDAGQALALAVAGRRLRAVRAASEELAAGDLAGGALDGDDAAAVEAAAALLARFAQAAQGAVTVRESRTSEGGSGGVSAARLTGAMPAPGEAAETVGATQAHGFLTLCSGRVLASLVRDADGVETSGGDAELAEILADMAELDVDGADPALSLWLRQTGPADGDAFGRAAFADGSLAVVAFAAADAPALASAYRESTIA